jgi:uncharacterized protein involved in exopolysaccharide biosynthesis
VQSQDEGVAPLAALRRRWPLAVLAVLLGTGAGVAYAASQATVHTAQARLAVGGTDISAYTIPGFAYTSKEVASNYARFITPEVAVGGLSPEMADRVVTVGASPIPESNLIIVEIGATDAGTATLVADQATDTLVAEVEKATSRVSPRKTLSAYTSASTAAAEAQTEYDSINQRLTALRAKRSGAAAAISATESQLRRDLSAAAARLSTLQVRQEALKIQYQSELQSTMPQNRLVKVRPAIVTRNDAASRRQRYGMAGAGGGFLLALVLATHRERRSRRKANLPDRLQPELREPSPRRAAEHRHTAPPDLAPVDPYWQPDLERLQPSERR